MVALYATVIKKNIYEEYDEEYGVKPIFILESDIFGSYFVHHLQNRGHLLPLYGNDLVFLVLLL
jgi:hypothetical protein